MESRAKTTRIAAHLILGSREEPFLSALCASLESACDTLIVNDNATDPGTHQPTLEKTRFGRERRLLVDRTPFTDFSTARNVCLRLHQKHDAGEWIAFVDADEVHGTHVRNIARNLHEVPPHIDFVDGYTWHFFQSFKWYMSIERRMAFFRFSPRVRWEGAVHEKLLGLNGMRLPLPYVYAHYGWVIPARDHARKGRHYSGLGAAGTIVDEHEVDHVSVDNYFEFEHRWSSALRFTGLHPPAAQPVVDRLSKERADEFARVEQLIRAHQPLRRRLHNQLMKMNYEVRWRTRALNPQARRLLA
jgi:hypothetical protein